MFIKNFSQLRAFRNVKINTSKTDSIKIKGKPINTKGKSLGGPKQDLPSGFIKRKLNKTKAIIIIRKTISLIRK